MLKHDRASDRTHNLLTTIYRQSWHPLAAANNPYKSPTRTTPEIHKLAGNLKSGQTPFQNRSVVKIHISPEKAAAVLKSGLSVAPGNRLPTHSRTPRQNTARRRQKSIGYGAGLYSPTAPAPSTPRKNDTRADSDKHSLSNLRRRLAIATEHHHHPSSPQPLQAELRAAPRALSRQPSRSSITSSDYRVVSYPNHVLASMCLEGQAPPVCPRTSSTRSGPGPFSVASSSAFEGELPPTTSKLSYADCNAAAKSSCSSAELMRKITSSYRLACMPVADVDAKLKVAGCAIAPQRQKSSSEAGGEACRCGGGGDCRYCRTHQTLSELTLVSPCDRSQSDEDDDIDDDDNDIDDNSDDDENSDDDSDLRSDISEHEFFSEDEARDSKGGGDALSGKLENESDQHAVERLKRLYAAENRSASASAGVAEPDDNDVGDDFDDGANVTSTYPFAPVLPQSLCEYSLAELSLLPPDVNWRTVARPPRRHDRVGSAGSSLRQRPPSPRAAQQCRARQRQDGARLESLVDRLLQLEKLQTRTQQMEIERQQRRVYHRMHTARSAKAAADRNNPPTASERQRCDDGADDQQQPAPVASKRRNSSASNARLEWANKAAQGENNLVERAMKDGDLTILHNHWLSRCSKSQQRRASRAQNGGTEADKAERRRARRSDRYRFHAALSKLYEYSWSEKVRPDKGCLNGGLGAMYSRFSSCADCRALSRRHLRARSARGNGIKLNLQEWMKLTNSGAGDATDDGRRAGRQMYAPSPSVRRRGKPNAARSALNSLTREYATFETARTMSRRKTD